MSSERSAASQTVCGAQHRMVRGVTYARTAFVSRLRSHEGSSTFAQTIALTESYLVVGVYDAITNRPDDLTGLYNPDRIKPDNTGIACTVIAASNSYSCHSVPVKPDAPTARPKHLVVS